MRVVCIDRDLLLEAANMLSFSAHLVEHEQCATRLLDALLAQPAEADGVESFDLGDGSGARVVYADDHLAALSAVTAERDALLRDAERYRWLRQRLVGASFDWDDEGMAVLAFEMPDGVSIGADCDKNIDAAMTAKEGGTC